MKDSKEGSPAPVDEAYAFDPTDPDQAKDFAHMARIRSEKPVCRAAENLVVTTRFAERLSGLTQLKARPRAFSDTSSNVKKSPPPPRSPKFLSPQLSRTTTLKSSSTASSLASTMIMPRVR